MGLISGSFKLALGGAALWVGLAVLARLGEGVPASSHQASSTLQREPLRAGPVVAAPGPGSQWRYQEEEDDMSKGITHQTRVLSSNEVEFHFPYSGPQHAALHLMIHPRLGRNVILQIERGQILCHLYDDCSVLVRFDDEPATRYAAVPPADGSTTQVFIQNYGRFMDKLVRARRVRISPMVFQEGAPVFDFDVRGFDIHRFKGDAPKPTGADQAKPPHP